MQLAENEYGKPVSSTVLKLCPACLLRRGLDPDERRGLRAASPAQSAEWQGVEGTRVGGYELLEEIASGGMGIVYRARQLHPTRVVALKIMLPYHAASTAMRARFGIESDAIAHLDHPGVLPIYEVGEHDGLPYFSMKFADGGNLEDHLPKLSGRWREIAKIMVKIARAAEHVHERGIVHRDLKPANILLDGRGEPMVADFGLAKFRTAAQHLTLPSTVLGSPQYMAPERVSGTLDAIGPHTDVYSLGAMLYEMLTGRPPILGADPLSTLRMVTDVVPGPGTHSNPLIPAPLDAIALKCLEKKPAHRYASAAALADDLERWLRGERVTARWRSSFPSWVRRAKAAALIWAKCAVGQIAHGRTPSGDRQGPESNRAFPAL
jgi:serine/threonine protein kinase